MPSLDLEGFGLVTAEAMACGTPVIASDAGANPEVAGALNPKLIYPKQMPSALTTLLEKAMGELNFLPDRDATAQFAQTHFRWDRPADAFEKAHVKWAISSRKS